MRSALGIREDSMVSLTIELAHGGLEHHARTPGLAAATPSDLATLLQLLICIGGGGRSAY